MGKKKNTLVVNLEYMVLLPFIKALQIIPFRIAMKLSVFFAIFIYLVDFKHRKRTIQHLLHAGIAGNHREARKLALKVFISVTKVPIEALNMKSFLNEKNVWDHLKVTGSCSEEALEKFIVPGGNGQPILAISPHFGSWEIGGILYTLLTGRSMLSVMRPFDNPKIGDFIFRERVTDKHHMCSKDGAVKPLLKTLRKGGTIGILVDQHASSVEGVETTFFGHPARTHASPAMLHLKTGVPIFVAAIKRIDDNFNLEMVVEGIISVKPTDNHEEDIRKVAQLYTDAIERIVRQCPEQWLWTHRRWLDINRKKKPRNQEESDGKTSCN